MAAGLTIRRLGLLLGYEIDEASERKAENSIQSFKNGAKKVLGAIGLTVSVVGVAKAINQCVGLASEVEEMENKFNVVFGNIRNDVDEWAQSFADAVGRNKNDIKTYLADQQNLLVGFGMTREAGAELSKQMTTLALDLASFGNMDEAESVDAMTKAVMGQSEAAKRLGAVLNDSTREQAMQTLGLKGTYNSLDQLTKMQVNYQAILSQSPDAIGDCERSLGSYQSTLKSYNAKLKELKTIVGQFFMPTFQRVLSFGAKGLTMLRNVAQRVSDFAEKVGGSERIIRVVGITLGATLAILNGQKIFKAIQAVTKLGKAFGVTAAGAMKVAIPILLLVLLIQDFLAFMRGDNSLIGEFFKKAGIDADEARQTITDAWNTVKTVLLRVWDTIKGVCETVFGAISGFLSEHGDEIWAAIVSVWDAICQILKVVWSVISAIAVSVFGKLKSFWERWGDDIKAVFDLFVGFISRTFERFIEIVRQVGEFFSAIFAGDIEGALYSLLGIFQTILEQIIDAVTTIFSAIWVFIGDKVIAIKDAIVEGFTAAIDWIKALPAQALQWGADIIQGIVDGIKNAASAVGDAVKGVADKIKSFLGFSVPEDGPLSDFDTYMPDMIDLMTRGIKAGKSKVQEALGALTGDMSVMAKANIVSAGTAAAATRSVSNSKSVNQTVNINNQFNGDRAGQKQASKAMDKASGDATSEMARALAFSR